MNGFVGNVSWHFFECCCDCIRYGTTKTIKRLQEKNQQIKALAKKIVSESQTVGEYLRSKDIENIERILSEYEQLLQNSLIVINSNHHSIANNKSEKNTYEEIL